MRAVAIKKGQMRERAPHFREMGTFRCDTCGEEFILWHDPAVADKGVAARQALWLEKFLPRNTNGSGSTRIASNCRTTSGGT